MADSGFFKNYFNDTNEWAEGSLLRYDARGADVYFACAGYGPDNERKQANVVAVRSFWLDIDTNENGKGKSRYANRKEAVQALAAFCRELGLTQPLLVSSGYGIHAYWPCDEDMKPTAWKRTATLLKKATKQWGLDADPSRTSDEASVLRAPGTHNYKRDNVKDVKLLTRGDVTTHAEMHMALAEYVGEDEADELGERPAFVTESLNADLMVKTEFAPSDANKIAQHCGVVREMRDTGGDMDEPTWYGCIGVLAFTEQADDICHEWSQGYDGYSAAETQRKINQAKAVKPTTCERLSDCRPATCAACPWSGKIKSPITLGMPNATPEPIPTETLTPEEAVSSFAHDFPKGFGWGKCGFENKEHGLYRIQTSKVEADDGSVSWVEERVKFASVLFYPVNRIRSAEGIYSMNIKVCGKEQSEYFILPLGSIMEGGKALFAELGNREIAVQAKNKPDVASYLTAWMDKLRDEYAASPAITQFGWHGDEFVVGDTMYGPNSSKRKAILSKGTVTRAPAMEPSGDLQTWVSMIDRAYNHPGDEALQFMVLTGFACPLVYLLSPNSGIFVHAYNSAGGEGKSTAQEVAMSVWGSPKPFLLREDMGSTVNAMYAHFGVMNNLPVVVDEMSKCSNEFAASVAYNASAGQGKRRLAADGSERETLGWSTIFTGSSNRMLAEKIAATRAGATAEMHRIWEYRMPAPSGKLPLPEAKRLFPMFNQHYGHAGRVFIEYVVNNRAKVTDMLFKMRDMFDAKCNIQQDERYWSTLHACVLTALAICRKLDLLRFDASAMLNWIEVELEHNRQTINDTIVDPLETFADMLADIYNGMLVTIGEGNLAQGSEATVIKHPHGKTISGRSIIGTTNSAEKLFVNVNTAKSWCDARKVSYKEIRAALVGAGWAGKTDRRLSLGKGTKEYSGLGGPVKVIELNPSAVRDATGSNAVAQKVTQVISGGMDGYDAAGSAA